MKKFLALLLSATMMVGMTACGSGGSETASADGSGDKELNMFVWTEYVPQSVIDKFTEETGIKVNLTTYSSNEDMLAKVKSESEGAFDLIQPSDYMVEQCINQGLVKEIDTSKLTNYGNISDAYKNPSYDPESKYSIPYLGGLGGIAVNTSKITDDIHSYAELFDSKYANSIVALDDYRAVIGMAAKSLGYGFNESDPEKLSKIKEQVLKLKNNIKLYDSDSPKSALISGDCNLAYCWSAEIALANAENPDIQIKFPDEGAYLFLDNWCITKGAKHSEAAMKWLDFILDADNMSMVLDEFPYLCPNEAAVAKMGDDYSNNPAKNPPADEIKKGEYVKNLDSDTLAIYDQIWTELMK